MNEALPVSDSSVRKIRNTDSNAERAELSDAGRRKDDRPGFELATFAGRLTELSGSEATAALTLAFRLVHQAQRRGEPVAWITRPEHVFYPPDVARAAVDLNALVVVLAPGALAAARAADRLLRSGGFGMVALDLGREVRLPPAVVSRLGSLARKHHAAVVCLTDKEDGQSSIGPLVSIRAEARRLPGDPARHESDARFRCGLHVLKDKCHGRGWAHEELVHGPDGLH